MFAVRCLHSLFAEIVIAQFRVDQQKKNYLHLISPLPHALDRNKTLFSG